MAGSLVLIGIVVTVFAMILLINIFNKKAKYIILIGPFVLAGILYLSIFALTEDLPPDVCDGGALMGILISFVLIAIGILVNIINILHLVLTRKQNN